MRSCRDPRRPRERAPGFTLVELLVVVGVVVVIASLLVPSLEASRERERATACAARLQQVGIGLTLYLSDHANALPQVRTGEPGRPVWTGAVFGGTRGASGTYARFGPEDRPLNPYIAGGATDPFLSPADRGGVEPGVGAVRSIYEFQGSSYTLNERTPRADAAAPETRTLIPAAGGAMPPLTAPARTWMLAGAPIMNYDLGLDRHRRWYDGRTLANLLFADNHVRTGVPVAPGAVESTPDYTFLP